MDKEKIGKLCTVMSKKDLDGLKKLQKELENFEKTQKKKKAMNDGSCLCYL